MHRAICGTRSAVRVDGGNCFPGRASVPVIGTRGSWHGPHTRATGPSAFAATDDTGRSVEPSHNASDERAYELRPVPRAVRSL